MYTLQNTNTNLPSTVEETEELIKKTPAEIPVGEQLALEYACVCYITLQNSVPWCEARQERLLWQIRPIFQDL